MSVCLSVRPSSHSSIASKRLKISTKDIVRRISQPGSPIILVPCGHPLLPSSKENPLSGGIRYTRVGKFCDFRFSKSSFILETVYETGPYLLWNVNRKSYVTDRSVSVPVTLSDLERRVARGQMSQADLLNNARTVRPRTTNFGRVTRGEVAYLGLSPAPTARGPVPSAPQFLEFSTYGYL